MIDILIEMFRASSASDKFFVVLFLTFTWVGQRKMENDFTQIRGAYYSLPIVGVLIANFSEVTDAGMLWYAIGLAMKWLLGPLVIISFICDIGDAVNDKDGKLAEKAKRNNFLKKHKTTFSKILETRRDRAMQFLNKLESSDGDLIKSYGMVKRIVRVSCFQDAQDCDPFWTDTYVLIQDVGIEDWCVFFDDAKDNIHIGEILSVEGHKRLPDIYSEEDIKYFNSPYSIQSLKIHDGNSLLGYKSFISQCIAPCAPSLSNNSHLHDLPKITLQDLIDESLNMMGDMLKKYKGNRFLLVARVRSIVKEYDNVTVEFYPTKSDGVTCRHSFDFGRTNLTDILNAKVGDVLLINTVVGDCYCQDPGLADEGDRVLFISFKDCYLVKNYGPIEPNSPKSCPVDPTSPTTEGQAGASASKGFDYDLPGRKGVDAKQYFEIGPKKDKET